MSRHWFVVAVLTASQVGSTPSRVTREAPVTPVALSSPPAPHSLSSIVAATFRRFFGGSTNSKTGTHASRAVTNSKTGTNASRAVKPQRPPLTRVPLSPCNMAGFAAGGVGAMLWEYKCPGRSLTDPHCAHNLSYPLLEEHSSALASVHTWEQCSAACAARGAPFFGHSSQLQTHRRCMCGSVVEVHRGGYNDGQTVGGSCGGGVGFQCEKIISSPFPNRQCPPGQPGRLGWCCQRIPMEAADREPREPAIHLPKCSAAPERSAVAAVKPAGWCIPASAPALPRSVHAHGAAPPGFAEHCDDDLEWSRILSPGANQGDAPIEPSRTSTPRGQASREGTH